MKKDRSGFMRFEFLTVASDKIVAFWNVTLCIVWYIGTSVLEGIAASIFRVEVSRVGKNIM